ncbi:hypothetical protein SLEP1_g19076 [Rubroshorea leprosula]|nr:hypothetical protein SLEP1_g19076 [Rubroshorea leprosula]
MDSDSRDAWYAFSNVQKLDDELHEIVVHPQEEPQAGDSAVMEQPNMESVESDSGDSAVMEQPNMESDSGDAWDAELQEIGDLPLDNPEIGFI